MKKIQIKIMIVLLIKLPAIKPIGNMEIKKMFKFCILKTFKLDIYFIV